MENIKNHTITVFSWRIKGEHLVIRKAYYNVFSKIKNKRKREKREKMQHQDLKSFFIPIVWELYTETRTRSWHGGGMQQDDINCSEDYVVSHKKYPKKEFYEFLNTCIADLNIPLDTVWEAESLVNLI